jgi:hypothetical protein
VPLRVLCGVKDASSATGICVSSLKTKLFFLIPKSKGLTARDPDNIPV